MRLIFYAKDRFGWLFFAVILFPQQFIGRYLSFPRYYKFYLLGAETQPARGMVLTWTSGQVLNRLRQPLLYTDTDLYYRVGSRRKKAEDAHLAQ